MAEAVEASLRRLTQAGWPPYNEATSFGPARAGESMQFNVAQLLKGPIGSSRRYTVDHTFERLADTGTDHAEGQVVLTRTDQGIWVSGALEATAVSTCSRCLASFHHPVRFQLDEEYLPTVDIVTGTPLEVPNEEEGAFAIDQHHVLDLIEAVRQSTVINMPMKPLCRTDCRGICPECGLNLNEGTCRCPHAAGDPRFQVLRQLLASKNVRTR